jgi:hypothetical protein
VNPLLSGIGARRYAKPEQLYELASACLRHLTMCVRAMRTAPGPAHQHAGSYVLAHLLSPGTTLLRELLTHVAGTSANMQPLAVDALAARVAESDAGRAAEAALAALLELLNTVFGVDEEWVRAQRRRQHAAEALHAQLMRPASAALQLMQFVAYSSDADIQLGAVRLIGFVSTRDPDFTHALLQFPGHARKLVYDCALCLGENLFAGLAEDGAGDEEAGVADVMLQVLLDNASLDFPTFTQLALGYSVLQARATTT